MERITLPEFYCPFSTQLNPFTEKVHQHTLSWATSYQLLQHQAAIQRFNASGFAWLAGRAYPSADFEELALTNDFFTWLFLLDDQFDDGLIGRQPEQMSKIIGSLLMILGIQTDTPCTPLEGPLADSLHELWERMLRIAHPQWQKRFTHHLLAYFNSYGWETRNRASGHIPEVESYLEIRQDAGAMRLALDYMDLTEHINLPAEIYGSSLVQALLRITNNVVCWSNDIFSLHKELARGDLNNLVLALQQEQGCVLQEAVQQVDEMVTREVELFLYLATSAPDAIPAYKEEIQKYLAGMQAWMRGNLDWSLETHRYSDVEQLASGHHPDYLEAILPLYSQNEQR